LIPPVKLNHPLGTNFFSPRSIENVKPELAPFVSLVTFGPLPKLLSGKGRPPEHNKEQPEIGLYPNWSTRWQSAMATPDGYPAFQPFVWQQVHLWAGRRHLCRKFPVGFGLRFRPPPPPPSCYVCLTNILVFRARCEVRHHLGNVIALSPPHATLSPAVLGA